MSPPTLQTVAVLAGVSKMTASRALRNASGVSRESAARVHAAASKLGYLPNRLALSLSLQRSNLIGVIVPSMSNIVYPEVVSGISSALEGSSMQAVFGISEYDNGREYAIVRNMLTWHPAAMILAGLDQSEETKKQLKASRIPIVQMMDIDGEALDFNVGLSHREAGAAMARALVAKGREKFAYVGSALAKDGRAVRRKQGFEDALAEHGRSLVAQAVDAARSSIPLGKRLTLQLLHAGHDLDCIYYSSDDMAVGGLFACMERGIEVPNKILPAGFNGLEIVDALPIHIATSRSPRRQIGYMAAEIALKAIVGKSADLPKIVRFEPEIMI